MALYVTNLCASGVRYIKGLNILFLYIKNYILNPKLIIYYKDGNRLGLE